MIVMLFYQMRLIRMKKSKQRLECQVMARTKELQVSNQKLTEEMDRFSKVMSSLDLSIYVADINTYELLFVNKKVQGAFISITLFLNLKRAL
ncbi:MAG: hypothetical protein OMM_13541 [Candidatus Magnetoglobus multicellularis str. Araruama]|uniref:Uncharacterized protein n=1 Tax=Candidatus Magnetoglobus multicellularis str. Araruama TaxID=890399 RepID=A0A1V1NTK4_9BACT|nr:MAG: hypothetical protein OMM_13541 [Candidatus Magnetoglobus multicellularis str. Araruama]